jgi:ABC-type sugar transport system permease subunit
VQPYLLINPSHVHPGNYVMSVYLFVEGFQKADYGKGAAISLLMLVIVAAMSFFYVRKMLRVGEVE